MKLKQIMRFLGSHWLWWPFARHPWVERLLVGDIIGKSLSKKELAIALIPYALGALLLFAGTQNYVHSHEWQQHVAMVKQQREGHKVDGGGNPYLPYWFFTRPIFP